MGNGLISGRRKTSIFITYKGTIHRVDFHLNTTGTEIKELIAATIGQRSKNVVLRTKENNVLLITGDIPPNKPSQAYKVDVAGPEDEHMDRSLKAIGKLLETICQVEQLKKEALFRVNLLEERVDRESQKMVSVTNYQREIKELQKMLESQEEATKVADYHRIRPSLILANAYFSPSRHDEHMLGLRKDIPNFIKYNLSKETINYLKKPTFDVWQWEPNEMMFLLEHMYQELGLVEALKMDTFTLKRFLVAVQENYRNNPFHNFRHCFCVAQMMYGMIHLCGITKLCSAYEIAALLTAAICHDLDHPGTNNTYQINAKTELAIRYNDVSPLENHHCFIAFKILGSPLCNIFNNVPEEHASQIRADMIMLILATDMARHNEIFDAFQHYSAKIDFESKEHLASLKMILIKACDVSNEVRPTEVSEPWIDCLLQEYFNQAEKERKAGLPVAPFMDAARVTKPASQVGFLKFVLLPLFESLYQVFPQIEEPVLVPLQQSLEYYQNLQNQSEEKKSVGSEENRSVSINEEENQ